MNLDHMLAQRTGRSVLIMSALPADGRTLTATALARAMWEISPPVLLVDADPFGVRPEELAMAPAGSNGSPKIHENGHARMDAYRPAPGLYAREFLRDVTEIIAQSNANGTTLVIDTPPCLNSTIAFGLAPRVSGVVYVSRPGVERRVPHSDIRNQLDLLGAHVFGVVVNEG
jgi:Mrp family chromosome partitioning ATPase